MKGGLSGAPIDPGLKYAHEIESAAISSGSSPALMYAIACNESILGEYGGKWDAATVESADGGHGLFQLTSSWPSDWQDPQANANFAATQFVVPAFDYWSRRDFTGETLGQLIAASFNAGIGNVQAGHDEGDLDKYTTDHYAARWLEIYRQIVDGTFRPSVAGDDAPTPSSRSSWLHL